jgi:hypothetical protein
VSTQQHLRSGITLDNSAAAALGSNISDTGTSSARCISNTFLGFSDVEYDTSYLHPQGRNQLQR